MKARFVALASASVGGAFVGAVFFAGSLHAQTMRAAPVPKPAPAPAAPTLTARSTVMPAQTTIARGTAPGPLSQVERASRIQAAMKTANLSLNISPGVAAAASAVRVTPDAPKHASGAEIFGAGLVHHRAAAAGSPDGEYAFGTLAGPFAMPYVQMRLPTEAGKTYVADCRLSPAPGTSAMKVHIGIPSGQGSILDVQGGHVLHAFKATAASTTLEILVIPASGGLLHHGFFYGCEFGKVG